MAALPSHRKSRKQFHRQTFCTGLDAGTPIVPTRRIAAGDTQFPVFGGNYRRGLTYRTGLDAGTPITPPRRLSIGDTQFPVFGGHHRRGPTYKTGLDEVGERTILRRYARPESLPAQEPYRRRKSAPSPPVDTSIVPPRRLSTSDQSAIPLYRQITRRAPLTYVPDDSEFYRRAERRFVRSPIDPGAVTGFNGSGYRRRPHHSFVSAAIQNVIFTDESASAVARFTDHSMLPVARFTDESLKPVVRFTVEGLS